MLCKLFRKISQGYCIHLSNMKRIHLMAAKLLRKQNVDPAESLLTGHLITEIQDILLSLMFSHLLCAYKLVTILDVYLSSREPTSFCGENELTGFLPFFFGSYFNCSKVILGLLFKKKP